MSKAGATPDFVIPVAAPRESEETTAALLRELEKVTLLRKMIERIYGLHPPVETSQQLSRCGALFERIRTLSDEEYAIQGKINQVETEARETRQRLGHAVDTLGRDEPESRCKIN